MYMVCLFKFRLKDIPHFNGNIQQREAKANAKADEKD